MKAELPWRLLAMAWLPAGDAHPAREALVAMTALFPFAICVPFGREPDVTGRLGLLWRAASHEAAPDAVLTRIEALLGLSAARALRYSDAKRGLRRTIALSAPANDAKVQAFLLAGTIEAEPWLRALLVDEQPAQAFGRGLLRSGARPPGPLPQRSPQVCTCHDVTEVRIRDSLTEIEGESDERLAQLQGRLHCGTSCGSCLPALRRLVAAQPPGAAAAAAMARAPTALAG